MKSYAAMFKPGIQPVSPELRCSISEFKGASRFLLTGKIKWEYIWVREKNV